MDVKWVSGISTCEGRGKLSGTGSRKKLNHHVVSTKPQPKWWEALGQTLPIRVACVQLKHPWLLCLVTGFQLFWERRFPCTWGRLWYLRTGGCLPTALFSFFLLSFNSVREKILIFSHSRNIFAYYFCCYADFYCIYYLLHIEEDCRLTVFHKGENKELELQWMYRKVWLRIGKSILFFSPSLSNKYCLTVDCPETPC